MNNYSDRKLTPSQPQHHIPWICITVNRRKNRHQTSIKLDYPLDYPGQTTSYQFSNWCNQMAKDNPTIFITMPANASHANMILDSIYKTIPQLQRSNCETIIRKMQARFVLSGFPLTIKTKCLSINCSSYVSVTSKYTHYLCRHFVKPKRIVHTCYPRQLFCAECKNKEKHHLLMLASTQLSSTDDLADFFSAIQISNNKGFREDTMME